MSAGCQRCYAERVAARFSGPGQPYEGLAERRRERRGWTDRDEPLAAIPARWTGEVRMVPEQLDQPLRWKKPRRVFVNSMSDLFHEKLTDEQIDQIFAVMLLAQQHTFQVLTKRPERMRAYFADLDALRERLWEWGNDLDVDAMPDCFSGMPELPLPNVWLGVSVEDQKTADERIPLLLQAPAAVRFVSCEPMLGPVSFRWMSAWPENAPTTAMPPGGGPVNHFDGLRRLDWIIVGGESGPGARPCDVAWIRSIVEQCRDAGVSCFVKQLGARPTMCGYSPTDAALNGAHPDVGLLQTMRRPKGDDPTEWPEDLRVQQFPAGED